MYVQVYLEHCCDIDIRIVYCIMMITPHTRHAYITYKMMKNYRKIKKTNIQQTEIYKSAFCVICFHQHENSIKST